MPPAPICAHALACEGVLRTDTQAMLIRLVDGRPVSLVTTQVLGWLAARLAADGTQALCIVWDHASWPVCCAVRTWMKAHTQRVKRAGGWRLGICQVPTKSPWRQRIEPPGWQARHRRTHP